MLEKQSSKSFPRRSRVEAYPVPPGFAHFCNPVLVVTPVALMPQKVAVIFARRRRHLQCCLSRRQRFAIARRSGRRRA